MSRIRRWTRCAVLGPPLLLVVGFASMAVLNEVANPFPTLTPAELLVFTAPYVAMSVINAVTVWVLWWPVRGRSVVTLG